MNLTELKKMPVPDLVELAQSMKINDVGRSRKQDLIFAILKAHAKKGEDIYGDGVVEILQDGFGFLRSADSSFPSARDVVGLAATSPAMTATSAVARKIDLPFKLHLLAASRRCSGPLWCRSSDTAYRIFLDGGRGAAIPPRFAAGRNVEKNVALPGI